MRKANYKRNFSSVSFKMDPGFQKVILPVPVTKSPRQSKVTGVEISSISSKKRSKSIADLVRRVDVSFCRRLHRICVVVLQNIILCSVFWFGGCVSKRCVAPACALVTNCILCFYQRIVHLKDCLTSPKWSWRFRLLG